MKKVYGVLAGLMIFCALTGISQAANTMIFDPSEYPVIPEIPAKTTTAAPAKTTTAAKTTATSTAKLPTNTQLTVKETESFQNALFQLDSVQVDIRNTLLDKKTRFAEVDSNYKVIKEERNALKKEVKTIEKRVKEIEKAKEKIRKSML